MPETAARRLIEHGENQLDDARNGPFVAAVLSQLRNPLLWPLLVVAGISELVGEATEALVVIAILVLGSSITMLQEGRAGHALERLRERMLLRTRVIRAGVQVEVPATKIVPGDIVVLESGSLVPADAIVLTATDLFLAESTLTGEPFDPPTHPARP